MEKKEQLYEGKAKKVYATEDPNLVIVSYKDDATAFDGAKKGTIVGKGVINNQMTNRLMAKMEKAGIPTHFVEELSERDTLVKKGLHRPAGGHHPQHLRRSFCLPLRRGGGYRLLRAHDRVLLQER